MRRLLRHPWVRVLLIATTVAMCSMALRETASITLPVITALKEVLIPVAIGFTIAYVLTPVVDWLTGRIGLPRSLAAGLLFGLFSVVVVLSVVLVVPTVVRQSASMAERVFKGETFEDKNGNGVRDEGEPYVDANSNFRYDSKGLLAGAISWVEERQAKLRQFAEVSSDETSSQWLAPVVQDLEKEVTALREALPARIRGWATSGVNSADQWLELALDVVLVPIYAFFLLIAMPSIRTGVHRYLPMWHREQLIRIIRDIEKVVAAFFRGRLIVCVICALLTYIGFLTVGFSGTGVPYAALFSLFIGLATAVPLAGLLFLVPAVIMAGLDGGTGVTITLILIVYVVVQVLETVVLTPTIMGREVELHPVTLIIALLLCGKLLGILGLILAVPIAATVRILAREFFWPWLTGYVTTGRTGVFTRMPEP
jgi:predicted PurR-regulated permease PerM